MKFKAERIPLWKPVVVSKGYARKQGYERSQAHIDLMNTVGELMRDGYIVEYEENGQFPHTAATVVASGDKTRKPEARTARKRKNKDVNDPVGTKRVRKDNVRGNSAGEEAAPDVGRQRKRKPSA